MISISLSDSVELLNCAFKTRKLRSDFLVETPRVLKPISVSAQYVNRCAATFDTPTYLLRDFSTSVSF